MPTVSGTTILGDMLNTTMVSSVPLTSIALWFPRPWVQALVYRQVGVLRFVQVDAARLIIVEEHEVIYPGIWPLFTLSRPFQGLQANFRCTRPGLPYSFFWG